MRHKYSTLRKLLKEANITGNSEKVTIQTQKGDLLYNLLIEVATEVDTRTGK